ncbi:MAG: GAF domain-containing protein [Candidatus Rokuibacteriota bacterium]|nr:MAG: GAF domain-containing protein [Candidatus Rokubacteria bacterium]
MNKQPRIDPLPHLRAVAEAVRVPDQPRATFEALDRAFAAVLGHKLFTVLRYHEDTGESERLYTNQPAAYPVGGRKSLNPTPWTEHVLRGQRPYLGRTHADIRAVFFDHALIASLGCGSVLNLPVVMGGRVLGTLNLLHEEHRYEDDDAGIGHLFAALAIPAFLGGLALRF